eukprot:CAMPEP_0117671066 /NCGR_PEP_ID=MMETSP0804-20121206/13120_1 /TAXON_ID=1074897 /ORGANISM="Tetraselmis astigmatica, Strain CCMP880" /LENGTH=338 /DNA_ID=CAMNT_0005479471 /DNA_START=250 /DNA_END=1266 /DNA_ORIENTATION=-
MSPRQERLFHFGVCSDVQYADIPNGHSFAGIPRFYRGALDCTARAVAAWQADGVQFALHLGDIVDGFAKENAPFALESVLQEFSKLGRPVFHLIGNHCLYNLPRKLLNHRMGIQGPPSGASYYSFTPHPGWRFVVLDSYDISLIGWQASHPNAAAAATLLDQRNPNESKNSPEGLEGLNRRFVAFNGGISIEQLRWLDSECQEAAQDGQQVIIFSHVPLCPGTCDPITLVWNYEEVMQVLHRHPNVVASFCGHTHNDSYVQDDVGIHHVVLKGIVEAQPGHDCHGIVEVFTDFIVIRGAGLQSAVMQIKPLASQPRKPSFGKAAQDVMDCLPLLKISK